MSEAPEFSIAVAENTFGGVGVFGAEVHKHGCFRWTFIVFWSLLAVAGLSTIFYNWTGLGGQGIQSGLFVAAIALCFVIYLYLKLHKTRGLHGFGIRVQKDGHIEYVTVQPSSGLGRKAVDVVVTDQIPGKGLTVLVDVYRSDEGPWTLGRMTLRSAPGQIWKTVQLAPMSSAVANYDPFSYLYVMDREKLRYIGGDQIDAQLSLISETLKRSGAALELTFSEFATPGQQSSARYGGGGLGLLGWLVSEVELAYSEGYRQRNADQMLAAGEVPVEGGLDVPIAKIVKQFGYRLVPKSPVT